MTRAACLCGSHSVSSKRSSCRCSVNKGHREGEADLEAVFPSRQGGKAAGTRIMVVGVKGGGWI